MRSHPTPGLLRSPRFYILSALIILLTVIHQTGIMQASPLSEIIDVVPYLLIILGAVWFGIPGGLICAILTSICYLTHLILHEGCHLVGENLHRTLNIVMFNVVGAVTGILAERQFRAMAGHRKLAAQLKDSYSELRRKTEELLLAEEHLLRANRLAIVGELTAGLAHEIGNPLGGIKGAAEILADGITPEDGKYRFSRLLLEEVERLDTVVSRFLDEVRPLNSAGRQARIPEIFEAVISLASNAMEEKSLEHEIQVGNDVPEVPADPDRLQQAFLNLLLNAIHATLPGGCIRLSAFREDDAVICRVEDNGQGIAKDDLGRIFDPFFTTREGGTGLGLAITQKIIEACRGEIRVESRLGQGTTFTIRLLLSGDS